MADPVVHVEVIGPDAAGLRSFYAGLFEWSFETASPVAPEVADAGEYGFVDPTVGAPPVAVGVGGGPGRIPYAIFYVGVDDVAAAVARAESLGGTRVMGPAANPNGRLVVAHLRDPAGNLVGLAGPR